MTILLKKTGSQVGLGCCRSVSSFCSTSDSCRVTVKWHEHHLKWHASNSHVSHRCRKGL